ncbi:MAG: hypothetical protein O2816_09545 [Planctomycetota bacterium]|nr:hypothetical protein [Planctomycetota bacterium]
MPGKELVTEACVRQMAPQSELVLGPNKIATPAALDLAFARGIRVRHGGRSAPAPAASDLWSRVKSTDGTYVVTVRAGRATVVRVDRGNPEPIGEE